MIDGHPFLTEELDRRRSDHRRILRAVPNELLNNLTIPLPDMPTNRTNRALAESALRHSVIPARLVGHPDDRFSTHTMTEAIKGLFGKGTADPILVGLHQRASKAADDARIQSNEFQPDPAAIVELVTLLVWADDLANDGYVDPRFEGRNGRRAYVEPSPELLTARSTSGSG
jgi:hypothetical protein